MKWSTLPIMYYFLIAMCIVYRPGREGIIKKQISSGTYIVSDTQSISLFSYKTKIRNKIYQDGIFLLRKTIYLFKGYTFIYQS